MNAQKSQLQEDGTYKMVDMTQEEADAFLAKSLAKLQEAQPEVSLKVSDIKEVKVEEVKPDIETQTKDKLREKLIAKKAAILEKMNQPAPEKAVRVAPVKAGVTRELKLGEKTIQPKPSPIDKDAVLAAAKAKNAEVRATAMQSVADQLQTGIDKI